MTSCHQLIDPTHYQAPQIHELSSSGRHGPDQFGGQALGRRRGLDRTAWPKSRLVLPESKSPLVLRFSKSRLVLSKSHLVLRQKKGREKFSRPKSRLVLAK